jgi:hypothetical protein
MAFFWVQQWVALPIIVEEPMGDAPQDTGGGQPRRPSHESGYGESQNLGHKPSVSPGQASVTSRTSNSGAPFYSQYSTLPGQPQRTDSGPSHQPHHLYTGGSGQNQPGHAYNMGAMAGALPDYGPHAPGNMQNQASQSGGQRISGASTPAVVYQLQQNLQYPHQGSVQYMNPPQYGGFAPPQFQGFAHSQSPQSGPYQQYGHSQQRMGPIPHQFAQFPQASPQYYYFPGAMGAPAQQMGGYPNQAAGFQAPYPSRIGPGSSHEFMGSQNNSLGVGQSMDEFQGVQAFYKTDIFSGALTQLAGRRPSENNLSVIPRGPPRKPKQSGHALWVGNLPPGATVSDLKDHFSREATRDIESLFLISKSNCAFVNYRSEVACTAAMQRFHDSRFQGVRLVCRLRRSSAATSGVPAAPAAMSDRRVSTASSSKSPILGVPEDAAEDNESAVNDHRDSTSSEKVPEKFFIVKSLTLQDLEQSVSNGIWATQAHNEDALNKAYEVS